MTSRFTAVLVAALAMGAGTAAAASDDARHASQDRLEAIAARMTRGESYDQATRETLPTSGEESRAGAIAAKMSSLMSYDQAARAAADEAARDEAVSAAANERWINHLRAMTAAGGAHDAGWRASSGN